MHLLNEVEKHLRASGMPATKFGREALGDPRFVLDLRNGRDPRPRTRARVFRYIAAHSQPEVR